MPHQLCRTEAEALVPRPRRDAEQVDGIRPEREEIVVNANLANLKNLAPNRGELGLEGVWGGAITRSGSACAESGRGSALRSILPFWVRGSASRRKICAGTM